MEILHLIVTTIKHPVNDAILVSLREKEGKPVSYQAGQFLTFIIDYYGKEERRSYSLSSTPGIDTELTVLIKRLENGAISRYLMDHLQPGDFLQALHPAGRFTIHTDKNNKRSVFLMAAGSGISPVFSLLKKLLFNEPLSKAILVYQNRDDASTIFKNELEDLQKIYADRFAWINLLSNPQNNNHLPRRLNNSLFEKLINPYLSKNTHQDFYICGPSAFMRMIQFVLKIKGVEDEQIRKENFFIDAVPRIPCMADRSSKKIILRSKTESFEFSAIYPETILQAALKNNIQLPYSCRGGRCATCTAICISGTVKMSINEVLTTKDLEQGLILTCVGYAETDLVLEF